MRADDVAVGRIGHRPITGPRSRAEAAPHLIGSFAPAPGSGCEVSRIWVVRFSDVMGDSNSARARRHRRLARENHRDL